MMNFHIGQLLASAGSEHYDQAIESFEKSYHPDPKDPWNYYVEATVGFLRKDLIKVTAALEQIKAIPDDNPYKMSGNENVVKSLKKGLESVITDYHKAYSVRSK